MKLSSATIRNEMSDLEQMGYIIQPHTSSGRIPSDKGYRFYVDEIVKEKDEALKEKNAPSTALVIDRVDRLEDMLRQMAKILAMSTNYATMISGPKTDRTKQSGLFFLGLLGCFTGGGMINCGTRILRKG